MKKVYIVNIVTNQEYGSQTEDPTDWIASCIANNSWGRPARECAKTDEYDEILWIEDFEKEIQAAYETPVYELDGEGELVMEDYTYQDFDGNDVIGQRPVDTGTTEIVPAVFETWVRLKAEYEITETDITTEYELEAKISRKVAVGKAIQDLSDTLIQLITGDNMESNRTAEEIAQMQVDFATINALISAGRLITAKPLIEAIDIVASPEYEELKSDILALYSMNGF